MHIHNMLSYTDRYTLSLTITSFCNLLYIMFLKKMFYILHLLWVLNLTIYLCRYYLPNRIFHIIYYYKQNISEYYILQVCGWVYVDVHTCTCFLLSFILLYTSFSIIFLYIVIIYVFLFVLINNLSVLINGVNLITEFMF